MSGRYSRHSPLLQIAASPSVSAAPSLDTSAWASGPPRVTTDTPCPTAKEVAEAAARGAGLDGKTVSITLEQARADMGPIADAFALDQRLTSAKARRELGWVPAHADPLGVLARG